MQAKWLTTLALTAVISGGGVAVVAAPASHADTTPPRPITTADFGGYQVFKLPNANVPNFTRRTVRCPSGKRAIGGGAEAQGNDAILVGSFPTDDATGWIGLGRQNANSTVGISVYVVCANVS
ncbi:hypothetical protein [Sphaerisporangium perillae]|uniref:hypothetical protein n=1 Tax=Sphaerisporangium perillae TaxID=2935860 RepID=UPI00200C661D|nr:hypothetical protein [Sphaerisporangium perillae]